MGALQSSVAQKSLIQIACVGQQQELEQYPHLSDDVQNLHINEEAELWLFKYFKTYFFTNAIKEYTLNMKINKVQIMYYISAIYSIKKFCFVFEIFQKRTYFERTKLICILPNMVKKTILKPFLYFLTILSE